MASAGIHCLKGNISLVKSDVFTRKNPGSFNYVDY